ncbi:Phenylacetic acid catabolic protein [Actinoplanes sp. NBRC 103695]|uniref:1,2-phenylacetyl-CoA epoxidase subunit PaaC n=1 Tax=Actinoplanes sp. NBRC 103695 TaxID=3032202 RepID=UPI0024A38768|nr:Phenylacetic acid catabolic protein [Actinoplanes sp. NBRC 103695]GLY95002.1 hypothetical protein Acsp02_22570 [Actinoplanes sp. NBRC 103695]
MSFDDAYGALTDHDDDTRWAYGTGFADPLAGVPAAIPPGVDRAALAEYCLMLGDDALIMSHRLQQWVTLAPELEDEVAIANIALDLLGQARLLLTRAAEASADVAPAPAAASSAAAPAPVAASSAAGDAPVAASSAAGDASTGARGEDALAFGRGPAEFRNVQLVERADADFAHLVARLLAFATWRLAVLDRLRDTADPILAAVATKAVKELTYHREYAAHWVVRLGDGTDESHSRMQSAIDALWPLLAELDHEPSPLAPTTWRPEFNAILSQVLTAATVAEPAAAPAESSAAAPAESSAAAPAESSAADASLSTEAPDAVSAVDDAAEMSLPGATLPPTHRGGGGGGARAANFEISPLAESGRDGVHTPALAEILDEMQGLARSVPGGVW